jgi:hypothetical protein
MEEPRPPVAVIYVVPSAPKDNRHGLRVPHTGAAVLLAPIPKEETQIRIVNLGEVAARVYTPTGETVAGAEVADVGRWCERFEQALYRAIDELGETRRRAAADELDMGDDTPIWEDQQLRAFAQSIAEACEMGTLLLAVGADLQAPTIPIEDFLAEPIHFGFTHAQAIDCAKRLRVRFNARRVASGVGAPRQNPLSAAERDEVFISYAHQDEKWRDRVVTMLAPAIRSKSVTIWYDGNIKPSQKWRDEIAQALARARVGVLLVTADFLASEFINREELPYLLRASQDQGVQLLWVLIGDCMYDQTKLKEIQAANHPLKPLAHFSRAKRETALRQVCDEILKAYKS